MRKFLYITMLSSLAVSAQEKLTLQTAIETALKNNYTISITRNEAAIAKNDRTLGNAGMLPNVTLNASGSFANNSTKQEYASGLEVDRDGVKSNNLNTGVALNWTIFDGLRMFAAYNRLGEQSRQGELALKIQVEGTVASIMNAYYDVVRQQQQQKAITDAIGIFEERVKIAEAKLNIGSGNKVDVLQAKVDLNEQRSALLRQKTAINNTKAELNRLLSRDVNTEFAVEDSMVTAYRPRYEELKTSVLRNNSANLFAQRNVAVSRYLLKEVGSQRWPRVGLVANYNFSRSENQAGFALFNQNLGFNAGFTASWTLFNGLNYNRQYKNAQLQLRNEEIRQLDTQRFVETGLLIAFRNFENALEILALEEQTYKLAKENVDIALERFRLASLTSIELKEAQQSLLNSETRLVTARYEAKVAETELMRLNGALVK